MIVEDHPVVAIGICAVLESVQGLQVCGIAKDGNSAMDLVRTHQPGLMVLDLGLGGEDGLALISPAKEVSPGIRVLLLSVHDETLYASRSIQAGASGYLMKEESVDRLVDAIRVVLEGGIFLSPAMQARMGEPKGVGTEDLIGRLTNRELHVYRLISEGLSMRQISVELNVSIKTAEAHRENIKRKLGLASGFELVRHAMETFRWR